MPARKKKTEEELFPHGGFHYRLEIKEPDGTKKGTTRISWFESEWHLIKHIRRYKYTNGIIDVRSGHELSFDPFEVKPKKTRKAPAKPKAKAPAKPAAKKPSATKASKSTKTKKPAKPAAKTKRTKRTDEIPSNKLFSTVDQFFEQ